MHSNIFANAKNLQNVWMCAQQKYILFNNLAHTSGTNDYPHSTHIPAFRLPLFLSVRHDIRAVTFEKPMCCVCLLEWGKGNALGATKAACE